VRDPAALFLMAVGATTICSAFSEGCGLDIA
jgi:hypothetical protein